MPTFRLLQARVPGDPVRVEERQSFADRLGVSVDDVLPYDLLTGETHIDEVVRGVDAVLVGGSGHYSIYDDEPWLHPFIDTLGALAAADFPTFASCFGFQALVVALGGEVVKDEANAEVGTFELALASDAAADPLFGSLPARFPAQLGHKDRAVRMPATVDILASSARCPYQALRASPNVYATQFHPELTGPENRLRFSRYFDEYAKAFGREEAQHLLDSFRPSPAADGLLAGFLELEWNR